MAGFTDFLEEALLNHVFGNAVYTPPTVQLALLSAVPTLDAGDATEAVGDGYLRQASPTWVVSTDAGTGVTTAVNSTPVSFGAAGASGWGTLVGYGLYDSVTTQLLMYGTFSFPVTVNSGAVVEFAAGDITVTLS